MQNRIESAYLNSLHNGEVSWKIPENSNGQVTVTIKDKKLYLTFHTKDQADLCDNA